VGYVENEFGLVGEVDSFQAAGPAGVSYASLDGGWGMMGKL
jgi:hypothetical protein